MGVHAKLWSEVYKYFGTNYKFDLTGKLLPSYRYPQNCSLCIVDGSGKIYHLPGGPSGVPFREFIHTMTQSLQKILDSDPTTCLFVMMDRQAPAAKRANLQRYNPKAAVVETPGSPNPNKVEVWREYAYEYLMPRSDAESLLDVYDNNSSIPSEKRFNWLVPAATQTQPGQNILKDYLANPHFKNFFQLECCQFWAENLTVKATQWLVITGPESFRYINCGKEVVVERQLFDFDYFESDPGIGHLIRTFSMYNINVISDDGDTLIVALLAQHHLVTSGTTFAEAKFSRQCNVINKWNAFQKQLVYFDIELMWKIIITTIMFAWQKAGVKRSGSPIMVFTVIAALNGNDYVRHFPQISPMSYFDAFFANPQLFVELTSDWGDDTSAPIKLNCSAIAELVQHAYKTKKPELKLANDVDQICKNIAKQFPDKIKVELTGDDFRQRLGNLAFYLTYFLWQQYAHPPPSEFSQDRHGQSLYGYDIVLSSGKTEYVYVDVPSLEHLQM